MPNLRSNTSSGFLILLLLCFSINFYAQTKIQVVTTTVEKNFTPDKKHAILIRGEKASITVKEWTKPEVKVILKLISKHTDKAVAEKELNYMRYMLEKTKDGIYLKNYFAIKKGTDKVNAKLKAEYEIFVPAKSDLDIKNSYGNVSIKDIEGKITLDVEYGNINLQNLKGTLKIKSYFGDITGEKTDATFFGKINHSNITLVDMKGTYNIEGVYGEVSLTPQNKLTKLEIKITNGDVTLETGDFKKYNYSLESTFGDIKLPPGNKYQYSEYSEEKKELDYNVGDNPEVNITTSFGQIIIK